MQYSLLFLVVLAQKLNFNEKSLDEHSVNKFSNNFDK